MPGIMMGSSGSVFVTAQRSVKIPGFLPPCGKPEVFTDDADCVVTGCGADAALKASVVADEAPAMASPLTTATATISGMRQFRCGGRDGGAACGACGVSVDGTSPGVFVTLPGNTGNVHRTL